MQYFPVNSYYGDSSPEVHAFGEAILETVSSPSIRLQDKVTAISIIGVATRTYRALFGCHVRDSQAYHGGLTNKATLVSNYQRLRSSGPPQGSPYNHKKALIPIHTLLARGCQAGRKLDQRLELFCHASKGQHAHAEQQGPNISLLAPALQKQWDHTANAGLGDIDIRPYSYRKVQWICDQCPDGHPHSWSATVASRTNGTGCPLCRGCKVCKHNSLAAKAPSVAAQWDTQ
ncbi:hypothetical protein ABBQ38_011044 [Trebouxia sp. C0009 RCD-2024]